MADRFTHNAARTEGEREKDVPVCLVEQAFETAEQPTDGRDARGQFTAANRAAAGSGFKAQIRRSLGDPDDPTVGQLVRDALKMYRGLLRALPYQGPLVRPLVAAQCRHSVLGTHYANLAAKAGLDTPAGMKLSDKAGYHDGLSGQFSTRAWDRAVRMAAAEKAAGANPHRSLALALGAPNDE
jgi:hypothetical protein